MQSCSLTSGGAPSQSDARRRGRPVGTSTSRTAGSARGPPTGSPRTTSRCRARAPSRSRRASSGRRTGSGEPWSRRRSPPGRPLEPTLPGGPASLAYGRREAPEVGLRRHVDRGPHHPGLHDGPPLERAGEVGGGTPRAASRAPRTRRGRTASGARTRARTCADRAGPALQQRLASEQRPVQLALRQGARWLGSRAHPARSLDEGPDGCPARLGTSPARLIVRGARFGLRPASEETSR